MACKFYLQATCDITKPLLEANRIGFKMPTKYCAHGLCDSDSRKHPNIKFAKFIPPSVNRLRSERWVHLMGRKNFTVDNVKAWTYICEKHFPDNVNLKYYEVSFDLIIEKGKK